jgi:hypothetical protein
MSALLRTVLVMIQGQLVAVTEDSEIKGAKDHILRRVIGAVKGMKLNHGRDRLEEN